MSNLIERLKVSVEIAGIKLQSYTKLLVSLIGLIIFVLAALLWADPYTSAIVLPNEVRSANIYTNSVYLAGLGAIGLTLALYPARPK